MDMQTGERDRSCAGVVDIECYGAAGEGTTGIAVDLCCDPTGGRSVDACNRRHFVRRTHVRLEMIGFASELRPDDTARKVSRVDIDVVVFGIFNQAPQEVEGAV